MSDRVSQLTFVIPPIVEKLWTFTYDEIYLGAAWMAALLRDDGTEVSVIDCAVDATSLRALSRRLRARMPDVVAIPAIYGTVTNVYRVARLAKQVGVPRVVVGGLPASFAYERMLAECPEIDVCVVGEGEPSIRALGAGAPPAEIPGAAYRGADGEVRTTARAPFLDPLDTLPLPARDLFPLGRYRAWSLLDHRYKGSTTIETKRGCAYACGFCNQAPKEGRKLRTRSVDHVLAELRHLAEHHPDIGRVMIVDNDFLTPMKHGRAILEGIVDQGLHRHHEYMVATRVEHFFKQGDALIDLFDRANVRLTYFGIESVNDKHRDELGKIRQGDDEIADLFAAMQGRKVWNVGSYMFGFPDEDLDDVETTLRSSFRTRPTMIKFNLATPYPGTPFFDAMAAGGHLRELPLTDLDHAHAPIRSPLPLERIFHRAHRRYFLSWDYVRRVRPLQMLRSGDWSRYRVLGHHVLWHEILTPLRGMRRAWRRLVRPGEFQL